MLFSRVSKCITSHVIDTRLTADTSGKSNVATAGVAALAESLGAPLSEELSLHLESPVRPGRADLLVHFNFLLRGQVREGTWEGLRRSGGTGRAGDHSVDGSNGKSDENGSELHDKTVGVDRGLGGDVLC
jgi:hypothetical protein